MIGVSIIALDDRSQNTGEWQARQMEVRVLNQVSSSFFTGRAGFSGSSAQQAGLSEMY